MSALGSLGAQTSLVQRLLSLHKPASTKHEGKLGARLGAKDMEGAADMVGERDVTDGASEG